MAFFSRPEKRSAKPGTARRFNLAGLLPLTPETLGGLLWMEDGAGEELNAVRP